MQIFNTNKVQIQSNEEESPVLINWNIGTLVTQHVDFFSLIK